MARDPVCMMDIEAETPEVHSEYEGKRIFETDPEPYLDEIESAGDRTRQEA